MSLYDKASLVQIPSGTKSGTLYSVLPANGDGDFDHTRASSATRVNKDGLIESVASGVPRLDYPLIDGVVQDCPALLLEPSRKNDITDYTGAGFTAFNGASITANDSTSPDGSVNATLMTTTGTSNELIQQASITILSGQSYTVSGYFKLKSGTLSDPDNGFKGLDGFSGGVVSSIFNSSVTSEWQRLSFTITSTTTSGRVQIKCEDAAEILVWGLQVEQGSYATSVIPTSGSTVTRNADVCNGAGTSAEFNDSEGVLFVETSMLSSNPNNSTFQIDDGTSTNRVRIRFTTTTNQINGLLYSGVGGQPQLNYTANDVTNQNKVAIRYQVGQIDLFFNGFEVSTATGIASPTGFDNLSLGTEGNVKQLMTFNQALTDSELEQITSWRSFGEMAKGQLYTIE